MKRKLGFLGVFLLICGLTLGMAPAQAGAEISGNVIIFHAGSLTVPFAAMEKAFEAKHPKVDILREAGGSTKMARMISELGKPADIMASADYMVIKKSLMPKFTDFNIRFATNQLVLCYTDKSKFAKEINKDNWYEILTKKGVVWGHSDPNLDPCGYRSLMVLQLAEKYYKKEGLYDKLIANRPKANIRPKSVELVSLLKTGNMDYAWEYLSVAVQHKLKYLTLPADINLGDYKKDSFYKNAKVKVTGKKPGTFMTRTGKSCTYGITLIKNSPNPEAAKAFLAYLLDPQGGLKILKSMGQPPLDPVRVPTAEMKAALPKCLDKLVEVKN
ncbi:tungstate ABC transporter substrate-binding protein WtpA [Dethiosulfatarculus sandiegensis]|uniref:ABC transporter substrate-binding protein n=1 Tax=Dethiosulfatarculus sandiegensis TaxID=1429043 RepID=A0A0D2JCU1_9BACT|nr:tungstate ABC transporter substrate-binding protein WtpA [Dethiosulfatarculus sandiegensis]KIX13571.1 ABC transporter substrate-binding protein [Dethiosulfatarculus sandiegensis]